jgi:hypothetical protein
MACSPLHTALITCVRRLIVVATLCVAACAGRDANTSTDTDRNGPANSVEAVGAVTNPVVPFTTDSCRGHILGLWSGDAIVADTMITVQLSGGDMAYRRVAHPRFIAQQLEMQAALGYRDSAGRWVYVSQSPWQPLSVLLPELTVGATRPVPIREPLRFPLRRPGADSLRHARLAVRFRGVTIFGPTMFGAFTADSLLFSQIP